MWLSDSGCWEAGLRACRLIGFRTQGVGRRICGRACGLGRDFGLGLRIQSFLPA